MLERILRKYIDPKGLDDWQRLGRSCMTVDILNLLNPFCCGLGGSLTRESYTMETFSWRNWKDW